ncbi:MAG: SRPBCC family protein [Armatimonadetes bacterium]|nr:SRPBCC family protein [Armatimonadota bacterium]
MPTVTAVVDITAPLDRVYALSRNIEAFPQFMPDVLEVEILERRDDGYQKSRWVGIVKEFKRTIKWTEEDHWDDVAHACTFAQTEGDFSVYRGEWRFAETDGATHVELELEYEYDVPLIGNLIKALLKRKMQENCDNMLAAIKAEAEKS